MMDSASLCKPFRSVGRYLRVDAEIPQYDHVQGESVAANRYCLLLVSDQPDVLAEVTACVGDEFEVLTATSPGQAMELLTANVVDLILAQQSLRPLSGLHLLEWARRHFPSAVGTLLAEHNEVQEVWEAIARGRIHGCVLRGSGAEELLSALTNAARHHRRERTLETLGQEYWRLRFDQPHTETERLLARNVESLIQNLIELEEDNRRLRRSILDMSRQATTDPLTGLLNRRAIESVAASELSRRARHGGPLAMGLIDADHFKEINRKYLLPGGDRALTGLAEALGGSLRATDRVGRVGGEEFLVIAPQTDVTGAAALAERLRQAVEQKAIFYNGEQIPLTVSVGFAVAVPGHPLDIAVLQHTAAQALADAKKAGRNRSVVQAVGGNWTV